MATGDTPRRNGLFPTTRWTIVRRMGVRSHSGHLPAWEEFVAAYRRPMVVWLTARCGNEDEAEELVQSLLVQLFTREGTMERVNPAKGRMRTWLLTILRNHWIDSIRRRKPPTPIDGTLECPSEQPGTEPDASYDAEWARTIATKALASARSDYEKRGNARLFNELLAAIDEPERGQQGAQAERLGMKANSFTVALMRFRERIGARLWDEVAITVEGGPEEIDEELRHLITVLGRSGGLRAAIEPPLQDPGQSRELSGPGAAAAL